MKLKDETNSKKNVEEKTPSMVLTIDIGNNKLDLLNIYDINNPEQDIYNFCLKNKLDFNILKEIKDQIQILITQNIQQNNRQNQANSYSKEISQLNEVNGYDKNIKYQNFINSSDNLAETNFNTDQQNNIEDINNLEILDGNNNMLPKNTNNNNLKKYYSKLSTYTTNTNNIKDTRKIIRHKIHKSKIEELDKEMRMFNNKNNHNISSQIFNNYTPNNSSFFISPSFNTNNHNPNIALRNYFSKEEDIYFTENNPYFQNNNDNVKNNKNKRKKNKKVNKSMSVNAIYSKKINPGQDLYERNMKYNEEKKEKIKILKKYLESDQDEDNTFSPKINKLSKTQNEHRKQKKLEYSNPEIIKNYKKYKDDKIKMLKLKQEKEYEKYTFKPIINNSSSTSKNLGIENTIKKFGSRIDLKNNNSYNKEGKNEVNKNLTRFEILYNERIHQNENRNKLMNKIYNKFPFKPKINEKSTYLKIDKPFKERLKTYSNKTKENMQKIKKLYEKEKSQDESFKPKINTEKNKSLLRHKNEITNKKGKDNNNNIRLKNIYSNLYIINHNYNKKNKTKKRTLINKSFSNNILLYANDSKKEKTKTDKYTNLYLYNEKYNNEKKILKDKYFKSQNKSPTCNNTSQKIINKKRENYFKKLFHILDNDEDNKISTGHINIFGLPKKIKNILEPIFISLEEEQEDLNENEFIYVCKKLYNNLSYIEKKEFMEYIENDKNKKEKKNQEENYTFKPKINKRNNSYEKIGGTTWGKSTHATQIFAGDGEFVGNFSKNYYNLKSSADISNKEIFLNNYHFINSGSGQEGNRKSKYAFKNIFSNKNFDISKNFSNNKNMLVNNYIIKNNLIKSTTIINKDSKKNDYFNSNNKK